MFCRSIRWFICIFVGLTIATEYSYPHIVTGSNAEVTDDSSVTDSPEPSTGKPDKEVEKATAPDLAGLLDAGDGAMVTLVAGDTRLVAHRAVLAARIPVFAALLGRDDEVRLSGVEGPVLRQLVAYSYTLRPPRLPSTAPNLLAAAHAFGLPALKADLEQQVAGQLTVETAATTAVLALKHSADCLRAAAVTFIKSHLAQVVFSQGWADAMYAHPEAMLQVRRLLSSPPVESSSPATADSGSAPATQPHGGLGEKCGAAAAASPAPAACGSSPPDDDCVSCARRLSELDKGRRLIGAAKEGAMEELQTLLTAGSNLGARDKENMTALHWAAEKGQVDAAKCLLAAGADVQAEDRDMETALHLAAAGGHVEVARFLVERGAAVDARDAKQNTPLHCAASSGHADVVRFLVASSAYHSARNQWGYTPLHQAAKEGHAEVATALLEAGADREARDDGGYTPLEDASRHDQYELVDILRRSY